MGCFFPAFSFFEGGEGARAAAAGAVLLLRVDMRIVVAVVACFVRAGMAGTDTVIGYGEVLLLCGEK